MDNLDSTVKPVEKEVKENEETTLEDGSVVNPYTI
jgi:hypothetical protein